MLSRVVIKLVFYLGFFFRVCKNFVCICELEMFIELFKIVETESNLDVY